MAVPCLTDNRSSTLKEKNIHVLFYLFSAQKLFSIVDQHLSIINLHLEFIKNFDNFTIMCPQWIVVHCAKISQQINFILKTVPLVINLHQTKFE